MNICKYVYKFIQCETHGYNVKDETSIGTPILIFGVGIIMTITYYKNGRGRIFIIL